MSQTNPFVKLRGGYWIFANQPYFRWHKNVACSYWRKQIRGFYLNHIYIYSIERTTFVWISPIFFPSVYV